MPGIVMRVPGPAQYVRVVIDDVVSFEIAERVSFVTNADSVGCNRADTEVAMPEYPRRRTRARSDYIDDQFVFEHHAFRQ